MLRWPLSGVVLLPDTTTVKARHNFSALINTISVLQWNLVCDNKYKISMSNTIYFTGVFCGALIFGFISDCIGRKPTLAICLYLQMPISLAIAFIPNYLGFIILRFLLGVWLQVPFTAFLSPSSPDCNLQSLLRMKDHRLLTINLMSSCA